MRQEVGPVLRKQFFGFIRGCCQYTCSKKVDSILRRIHSSIKVPLLFLANFCIFVAEFSFRGCDKILLEECIGGLYHKTRIK